MKKSGIAAAIAVIMTVLTVFPTAAAQDYGETFIKEDAKVFTCEHDYSSDELFAGYVDSVFYKGAAVFSTGLQNAGSRLEGDEKTAYDALVPILKKIASGERSNTVIHIGKTVNTGSEIVTVDGDASYTGKFDDFNITSLAMALLADMPYELYWHDKVVGVSVGGYSYSGGRIAQLIFNFTVSGKFRDGSAYAADTSKTGAAVNAANNAAAIIEKYADKSDFEKLTAYKNEICDLVTYNTSAAEGGNAYFAGDSDPWQMIYVFDNDETTNVVCEGYSKAFQYLCDSSVFNSSDIQCYSVTGTLFSGTQSGGHMWNTVTMPDGKNYLVDITNSDGDGARDLLFFKGMKPEKRTFTVTVDDVPSEKTLDCYVIYVGSQDIVFLYDDLTLDFWGTDSDSILILSENDYTGTVVGDSNGDGIIDPVDVANMQRYLAGWKGYDDTVLSAKGMDANGDGRVNPLDVVILARHIAKWEGYETLPYNP